jgi:hypothetical protein
MRAALAFHYAISLLNSWHYFQNGIGRLLALLESGDWTIYVAVIAVRIKRMSGRQRLHSGHR